LAHVIDHGPVSQQIVARGCNVCATSARLTAGGGNVRKSCRAWQWSYSDVLLGVVVIKRCTF